MSRHLPDTDTANLFGRSPLYKRAWLENWLKPRIITKSYNPFRRTSGDSVNCQLPLFPSGQIPTPWVRLEGLVRKACRGNAELLEMNLPLARSVHSFANRHSLTAEPVDVRSLTLAPGQAYNFSMSLILRYGGGASVAFLDLRRDGNLSPLGRLATMSVQHERFRAAYPEYSDLRLEVWRFLNCADREIRVFRHAKEDLVPYEQLVRDVTETYEILRVLTSERDADSRAESGDLGPLFGGSDV
jgi:hypothetical protein